MASFNQLENFNIVLDVDPEFFECASKYKSRFRASITTLYDLRFVGYLAVEPVSLDADKLKIKAKEELEPDVGVVATKPLVEAKNDSNKLSEPNVDSEKPIMAPGQKRPRAQSIESSVKSSEVGTDAGSVKTKKRKVVSFNLSQDKDSVSEDRVSENSITKTAKVQISKMKPSEILELGRPSIPENRSEAPNVDTEKHQTSHKKQSEEQPVEAVAKTEENQVPQFATKETQPPVSKVGLTFKCIKCEKTFKGKVALKNHYMKIHNYPENAAKGLIPK